MAHSKAERDALLLACFDSLVELSAPEREARLAALRQEDPELAAALTAMLAADGTDGALEAVPGLVAALHIQNSEEADGGALSIGDEVGPFVLQRCLGQGGMGEVWLATRTQDGFHQQVALKRIRRGMNSATALRRFQAERRILAELSHPHIARFIDGGVDARGLPWYAMSYVEGLPLNRYVQVHALGVRERVALLLQVTDAVAHAQNQLIVHRDLKPSNVLVDGEGVPHLLDFGIAKLLVGEGTQAETLTAEQALTPMYAAPEQIQGGRISTATDVYALGAMLYELLTDSLPHARAGLSLAALVAQVRGEISERPSLRLRQRTATGEFRSDTSCTSISPRGSFLSGVRANGFGGVMAVFSGANVELRNALIHDASAAATGAAAIVGDGLLVLDGVRLQQNRGGGGLLAISGLAGGNIVLRHVTTLVNEVPQIFDIASAATSERATTSEKMLISCRVYPTTVGLPVVPLEAWMRITSCSGTAKRPKG